MYLCTKRMRQQPLNLYTMEQINISKELAYECATALLEQHNALAEKGHDSCTLLSFRSLYNNLCALGHAYMISSAIRPVNPHNLPLFI